MDFLVLVTDVDGMETPQLSQLMYGGDGDYDEDASRERQTRPSPCWVLSRDTSGRNGRVYNEDFFSPDRSRQFWLSMRAIKESS